jgi:hypothetical protein
LDVPSDGSHHTINPQLGVGPIRKDGRSLPNVVVAKGSAVEPVSSCIGGPHHQPDPGDRATTMTTKQLAEQGCIARWLRKQRGPDLAALAARRAVAQHQLNDTREELRAARAERDAIASEITFQVQLDASLTSMNRLEVQDLNEFLTDEYLGPIRDRIARLQAQERHFAFQVERADWLALPLGQRIVKALTKNPVEIAYFAFMGWFVWACASAVWGVLLKPLFFYLVLPWLGLLLLITVFARLRQR